MSTREVLAAELLHEAVVASRSATSPFAGAAACGLGEGPELEFQFTDKARALIDQLWPDGLTAEGVEHLQAGLRGWVEQQDTFDRKRNHFMKDFRARYGHDRTGYSAEQEAAWQTGLATLYEDTAGRRMLAARELLSTSEPQGR